MHHQEYTIIVQTSPAKGFPEELHKQQILKQQHFCQSLMTSVVVVVVVVVVVALFIVLFSFLFSF
jgi:CHASE3 domain sensor protein